MPDMQSSLDLLNTQNSVNTVSYGCMRAELILDPSHSTHGRNTGMQMQAPQRCTGGCLTLIQE